MRPVGENRARAADVRVLAATNRNLVEEVKAGKFREDLLYRLRVFPIRLPALRERVEDLPLLARHLVRRLSVQLKKPVGEPSDEALAMLARYPFPGNVRELANELERAILLADPGAPITEDLLSDRLQEAAAEGVPASALQRRTDGFERDQIEAALAHHGGVKARAAEELGITYRGLLKKMRRLGMGDGAPRPCRGADLRCGGLVGPANGVPRPAKPARQTCRKLGIGRAGQRRLGACACSTLEVDADARAGDVGRLGHCVYPVALAASAHNDQVPRGRTERLRRAARALA